MKATDILETMGQIDDAIVWEVVNTMYNKNQKNGFVRKPFRSLLAAALLVSLFTALGAVAYAADLFGIRALLLPEPVVFDGVEYSQISLSQPQALPEELSPLLSDKLASQRQAWREWQEYREKQEIEVPVVFQNEPEGCSRTEFEQNPDGSWTAVYYDGERRLGEQKISNEEYAYMLDFMEMASKGYPGYDYKYGVNFEADAKKLEEIAGKYALELRRSLQSAYSSETSGMSGPNFYTNAQLAEKTAEIGCSGNLFRETPDGFDKLYWYQEGSFGVSYYVNRNAGGAPLRCYGYNSPYTTLSSGEELCNWEEDVEGFVPRRFTASDGTELTILSGEKSAYLYAFLDKSFFVLHIFAGDGEEPQPLTAEEIDAIADGLNYSRIGK